MLLETLDLRRNDVLIYSQNRFNFNDNFKIIYKNEKIKRVRSINYFDVCNFVKEATPKNLIVYRLLTNVSHLDAFSTKYGYFIKVNGKAELVYFDPIFAIKDLRHLRFDFDPDQFRFKIQQLGLTSLTKRDSSSTSAPGAEAEFAEVYSFDLKAFEAQNQNDKIFSDAIFAFDEVLSEEEHEPVAAPVKMKEEGKAEKYQPKRFEAVENLEINEDRLITKQNMNRVEAPSPEKIVDLREEIVDLLKQALGIQETAKSKESGYLPKTNIELESGKETEHLFDLFKTTNKTDNLPSKDRDTVVLKFGKSKGDEVNPYR